MLTKAEVNKALALLDEWKYEKGRTRTIYRKGIIIGRKDREWLQPDGIWRENCPDYCGDWKALGPWLEKMVEAGSVDLSLRGGIFFAVSSVLQENRPSWDESTGDTLTEACACEVLAWMEGTKKGV